jgi:hypothetical protein
MLILKDFVLQKMNLHVYLVELRFLDKVSV